MKFLKMLNLIDLELFIVKETVVGGIKELWRRRLSVSDLLSSTYEGPEGDTRKGNWYTFIRSMYESDRRYIREEKYKKV